MTSSFSKIVLKSPREIALMRASGALVYDVLDAVEPLAVPGATTAEMNELATKMIADAGATALFLGVENPSARFPFPASLCTSVNDVVVHGIPNDTPLREGDIVSVDCGVRLEGYCGDAARTFGVGKISADAQRLLDVTRETLELAIREMRPDRQWSQIATKMQEYAESNGFGVVQDFVGHGLGREMHEEPKVPNYYDPRQRDADFKLVPGMTLAIEPMVTSGRPSVEYRDKKEGWAVVTSDGSLAAHFEHDIAITDDGVEILSAASRAAA